jgi:SAM-dependent methyltransferase
MFRWFHLCSYGVLVAVAAAARCCGPGCRDLTASGVESHYDEKYFAWQSKLGLAKAQTNDWVRFIRASKNDTVLDLGAGTGAILASMKGRVKGTVAVEFSDHAARFMSTHSPEIVRYKYPEQVPDESIDILFSTSVMEHLECPITELRELVRKLRPSGRAVIGIKNEGVELWRQWYAKNVDDHLYTWNSMLLGNTLRAAGLVVDHIQHDANLSRQEYAVVNKGFGRKGHVFQYLFAQGHKPLRHETWPQKGTATLSQYTHARPLRHDAPSAGKGKGKGKGRGSSRGRSTTEAAIIGGRSRSHGQGGTRWG